MADFQRINPLKLFENTQSVLPVYNKFISLAVAANTQVIAGVSGQRIRVMGMISQSNNAAAGTLQLLDGSGGTIQYSYPQPTNAQPLEKLPITNTGYFETSTGTGLYATVLTQPVVLNVFYIIYTPD